MKKVWVLSLGLMLAPSWALWSAELETWTETRHLTVEAVTDSVAPQDTLGYGAIQKPYGFFDNIGTLSYSPDSELVAYVHRPNGQRPGLWLRISDEEVGVEIAEMGFYPKWSPDGDLIAYLRKRLVGEHSDGRPYYGEAELWVATPTGESNRLLTPNLDCTRYAWSPDGVRIAATLGGRSFGEYTEALVVVDVSTGAMVVLDSIVHPEIGIESFSWSPNGRMIAYVLFLDIQQEGPQVAMGDIKDSEIFVINVDGKHKRQLTDTPWIERFVKWSRDGKRLVTGYSRGVLRSVELRIAE